MIGAECKEPTPSPPIPPAEGLRDEFRHLVNFQFLASGSVETQQFLIQISAKGLVAEI
jgi:hypothetical protein